MLARRGLELLQTLPDDRERARRELDLHTTLGQALMVTRGPATPEVETTYTRARELCAQVGEGAQLLPVLGGLCAFYQGRAKYESLQALGEEILAVAERQRDTALLLLAHSVLGVSQWGVAEFARARHHLEQGIALYDSRQHGSDTFLFGMDPGVLCLSLVAFPLWCLGYPDQALARMREALALARQLSRPYTLAAALYFAESLHVFRRDTQAAQERAREVVALSTDQGFPWWLAWGTVMAGAAAVQAGQPEEGSTHLEQGGRSLAGNWRRDGIGVVGLPGPAGRRLWQGRTATGRSRPCD